MNEQDLPTVMSNICKSFFNLLLCAQWIKMFKISIPHILIDSESCRVSSAETELSFSQLNKWLPDISQLKTWLNWVHSCFVTIFKWRNRSINILFFMCLLLIICDTSGDNKKCANQGPKPFSLLKWHYQRFCSEAILFIIFSQSLTCYIEAPGTQYKSSCPSQVQ